VSSFFWIQSMMRQDAHRTLLFDLDTAIQRLATGPSPGGVPVVKETTVQLTGVYHNLLRQWAEMSFIKQPLS
jgi:PKHD-type hydroxylase